MKCLNCKYENPDFVVYCKQCGTYLAAGRSIEYFDVLKALVLGSLVTAIFYVIFPMPVTENLYIRQLFSGKISEAITLLSLWSIFLIGFKYLHYREQNKAFRVFRKQTMNDIVSQGIHVKDVEQKLGEISQFLQDSGIHKFQNSLIFRRIRRIFHYVEAIPKKEEINKILDYQAGIDSNRLENNYTLLYVFIWAIPIMGFIGTVFGIGEAIGEFSDFIRTVDTIQLGGQMRSALGGVTSGLSVAFNTTFLALVFVIPIMVTTSSLKKAEEDLLLLIEEYCLEEIVPNLHVGREILIDEPWEQHLEKLMDLSNNWLNRLEPIVGSMSDYASHLKSQIQGLQPYIAVFSEILLKEQENKSGTHMENKEEKDSNSEILLNEQENRPSFGEENKEEKDSNIENTDESNPKITEIPLLAPECEELITNGDKPKTEQPVDQDEPIAAISDKKYDYPSAEIGTKTSINESLPDDDK